MWRHFWNSVYGQYKEKHFDFCTDLSHKWRTMPLPNKALQWLCFLSAINLREKSSLLAAWITSWKSGLQGPNPKANGGFSHYTVQYIFSSCWWVTARKNIYLMNIRIIYFSLLLFLVGPPQERDLYTRQMTVFPGHMQTLFTAPVFPPNEEQLGGKNHLNLHYFIFFLWVYEAKNPLLANREEKRLLFGVVFLGNWWTHVKFYVFWLHFVLLREILDSLTAEFPAIDRVQWDLEACSLKKLTCCSLKWH